MGEPTWEEYNAISAATEAIYRARQALLGEGWSGLTPYNAETNLLIAMEYVLYLVRKLYQREEAQGDG